MIAAATIEQQPFKMGVLKKGVHDQLVKDLRAIAADAAVMPKFICTPLKGQVSEAEFTWVKRFKFHTHEGHTGLCLTGKSAGVEDRMAAITGALVRNFIRARIFTVGQIGELIEDKYAEMPNPTCLLIPNFFMGKAYAGAQAPWRITMLHDLLLERHMAGLQTVIYVSDMKALASEYGDAFTALIKDHYQSITI